MSVNMADYMRNRRLHRRQKLIELLGGECVVCGTTEDLDIDHIDPNEKLFQLAGKWLDGPWEKITAEAAKCQLLCKEHHLSKTREEYKQGTHVPWNKDLRGEYIHGTARMYDMFKCRCALCKEAKRMYRRKEIQFHQPIPG